VEWLMRAYAFQGLELHRMVSTPFAHNVRMVRCLEKCGFEREGVLRDALWIQERFVDVVLSRSEGLGGTTGPALFAFARALAESLGDTGRHGKLAEADSGALGHGVERRFELASSPVRRKALERK